MEPFLIIFLTVLCWIGIVFLIRRDIFLAAFFFALWLYTIFTQIGYVFFSTLVIRAGVYGRIDSFYEYWTFVALSLGLVFLGMVFLTAGKPQAQFSIVPWRIPQIIVYFSTALFLYLYFRAVSGIENVSYIGLTSETNILYGAVNDLLGIWVFALYARFKSYCSSTSDRVITLGLLAVCGMTFFWYGVRTGDRSALLGLILGVVTYEIIPFRQKLWRYRGKILRVGLVLGISLVFLQRVAAIRHKTELSPADLLDFESGSQIYGIDNLESFVQQDYFAPSLTLFASQSFEYIDPDEVLRSNFFNTLIFFNYPTLGQTVGGLIMNTTRTQGFAYYILTEGYNFLGTFGFIYNGLVITLGLALWRKLAASNNPDYNRYMYGLMVSLVLPVVRAQTSYFVKDMYVVFLPGMAIFFLVCNQIPVFKRRIRFMPGSIHSVKQRSL
jgi:hypothetical protein